MNYYDELEISQKASVEVIKAAYKKLASIYHPDNKETGNEAKFKRLNNAHDILSDENKRREYDRKIGIGQKTEQEEREASEAQRKAQEERERQRREQEKQRQEQTKFPPTPPPPTYDMLRELQIKTEAIKLGKTSVNLGVISVIILFTGVATFLAPFISIIGLRKAKEALKILPNESNAKTGRLINKIILGFFIVVIIITVIILIVFLLYELPKSVAS